MHCTHLYETDLNDKFITAQYLNVLIYYYHLQGLIKPEYVMLYYPMQGILIGHLALDSWTIFSDHISAGSGRREGVVPAV